MKTPCEDIVWNIVPFIKKEFANKLVIDFGLNQKVTAEKLGTTEATISRYLSGKRGVLEINDEDVLKEIYLSVERISKENNGCIVIDEICRICRLIQSCEMI